MMRDRRREQEEGFKKWKKERHTEKEELKLHEKQTNKQTKSHVESNGHGAKVVDSPVSHPRGRVASGILGGTIRVTGFTSHDEKVEIRT